MHHDRREVSLEELSLGPLIHVGVRQFLSARYEGPQTHRHEGAMEICYLDSGRQTLTQGGEEHVLRGNTVFVTQPGQWHGVGRYPLERCRLYYLVFRLPRGRGRFGLAAPADSTHMVRELRSLPVTFPGTPRMKELLDSLLYSVPIEGDVPLCRTRIFNTALEFLLLVIDCARGAKTTGLSVPIQRAVDYVADHVEENLAVDALADVARLSVPRFHARFKLETGLPPAEYVQRHRVDRAKELLLGGSDSITAVAHSLGFSSSQYFASVFRRYTGQTPSRFRQGKGSDAS